MQATALFAGALAVATFAGAIGGASISTVPISLGGDPLGNVPRHPIDMATAGAAAYASQPDHYAIETREGRFEVGELGNRGLYSQARYQWHDPVPAEFYDMAQEVHVPDYSPEPVTEPVSARLSPPVGQGEAASEERPANISPDVLQSRLAMDLKTDPLVPAKAKVIHVASALAPVK